MSLSQTYNYDTAGNFTFDTDKIQIAASKASLKLIPNPGQVFSQAFTSDTGFTYDSAKAEFAAGLVQQKDQANTGAIVGATYTTAKSLSWSKTVAMTLTAVDVGTPVITSSRLVCIGANGASYSDADFGSVNAGTIRFKYTPNYTSGPSQNISLVGLRPASGLANQVALTHSLSGNTLRVFVNNAAAGAVHSATAIGAAWTPTAGTTYEFEFSWDSAAGTVRVFINGTLHGTLSTANWTRTATASMLTVGASLANYTQADASFEDVLFFSSVQHTATYTPGYTVPEGLYAASTVVLPAFSYTGIGTILAVTASSFTETGAPRYIVGGKYWSGSAWATSDGTYAQANPSATVVLQLPSLTVVGATSVVVQLLFPDSALVRNSVDALSVTVTGQIYATDDPAIEPNATFDLDALEGFSDVEGGTGAVGFQLRISGTLYYWTGATWAVSDGTYAQSNTAADVETNRTHASLVALLVVGKTLRPRALLHSATGQASPDLTSVTALYNFFVAVPDAPNECIVYGFLRDILGDAPVEDAALIVSLRTQFFYDDEFLILPFTEEAAADTDGRVEISLVETATDTKTYKFKVRYVNDAGVTKTVTLGDAAVPNAVSVNLAELAFA